MFGVPGKKRETRAEESRYYTPEYLIHHTAVVNSHLDVIHLHCRLYYATLLYFTTQMHASTFNSHTHASHLATAEESRYYTLDYLTHHTAVVNSYLYVIHRRLHRRLYYATLRYFTTQIHSSTFNTHTHASHLTTAKESVGLGGER